ncbi:MAG TPA: hypothetical protein VFQ13_03740 [Anaerolineales bacterium]|nr:hypothetical protein [Anaerolineales bacterium]
MKKTFVSTLIGLTLAWLLMATPALAKAQRTALAGTEHMFFGAPGSVQISGGWVQLRGVPLTGTFDFGTLQGTETQLVNAKLDPVTGDGIVWGTVTYTDSATGITCSGNREGKLTNYLITAKIVATCSDGSLLQGTLQDTSVLFPPGSPVPGEVYSEFNGELLSP